MLHRIRQPALSSIICAALLTAGCSRIHFDPSAGAETLILRTIEHPNDFEIEYLRTPEEGPLRQEQTYWNLFWFVPVNQPDLGGWLEESLPEGADAANVRASIKTPWYGYLLFFPTLTMVRVENVTFEADPVKYRPFYPTESGFLTPLEYTPPKGEEPLTPNR